MQEEFKKIRNNLLHLKKLNENQEGENKKIVELIEESMMLLLQISLKNYQVLSKILVKKNSAQTSTKVYDKKDIKIPHPLPQEEKKSVIVEDAKSIPKPSQIIMPQSSNTERELLKNKPSMDEKKVIAPHIEVKEVKEEKSVYRSDSQFVHIPHGRFLMNKLNSEKGNMREVELSEYMISRFLVTFDEYDRFCKETNHDAPDDCKWGRGVMPVINVSWYDAVNYCNWKSEKDGLELSYNISGTNITWNREAKGYRLPTEAEWEYAGKGASVSKEFIYAGSDNFNEVAWFYENCSKKPEHIAMKLPNEIGIFDMNGNLWEWCWDLFDKLQATSVILKNPIGATNGMTRVVKGGSWKNLGEKSNVEFRSSMKPYVKLDTIGFRIVKSL